MSSLYSSSEAINASLAGVLSLNETIEQDIRDGWQASLNLTFVDRGDKTVLKNRQQSGPLAVQRPLYPDGETCHTYLLHPPGGVVGGDTLNIEATIESGAHALITTPGATKFYRSNNKYAKQKQTLRVKKDARLEWMPQENIFFPNAHVRLDTEIRLEKGAQFWGWEMHCFGRPAQNEGFEHGHLVGKTEIYLDNQKLLTEGFNFYGGDKLMINMGLLDYSMMGTFYITSNEKQDLELVQSLLLSITQQASQQSVTSKTSSEPTLILGATQIEGLIVVRALGNWSEDILQAFGQIWQATRSHLCGTTPDLPRIWAT
ncbi:urease accessory protein UreD [Vibrio splendidus]|uniref:Urease accessory protein UreD n=1 Tax=Vibrio splendidus TaxID=29497 RepID=A0ABD5AET1_VIBSP|nr:urease accessory protein UreD [Vibrio splendidus]MDP2491654.1 urease accessory protein UreD [Vibrio splendidus]PMO53462.1 urease accessory protein ureD [Vibrio splendidus]